MDAVIFNDDNHASFTTGIRTRSLSDPTIIVYYKLNDNGSTIVDYSGNGYHAQSTAVSKKGVGPFGYAYEFSKTPGGGTLIISDTIPTLGTNFTISLWRRKFSNSDWPMNFSIGSGVNCIGFGQSNGWFNSVPWENGGYQSQSYCDDDFTGWHHMCQTYDHTTNVMNQYYDGALKGTWNGTYTPPSVLDDKLYLGGNSSIQWMNQFFDGQMCEVIYKNVVMTEQEIIDYYELLLH